MDGGPNGEFSGTDDVLALYPTGEKVNIVGIDKHLLNAIELWAFAFLIKTSQGARIFLAWSSLCQSPKSANNHSLQNSINAVLNWWQLLTIYYWDLSHFYHGLLFEIFPPLINSYPISPCNTASNALSKSFQNSQ